LLVEIVLPFRFPGTLSHKQYVIQDTVLPPLFSLFYLSTKTIFDDSDLVLSLLRAFVEVEAVSADPFYGVINKRGKGVVFSSHDCSSVLAPVDGEGEGSAEHQHKAVNALKDVIHRVKAMTDTIDEEMLNTVVSQMKALIRFLDASELHSFLLEEGIRGERSVGTKRITKLIGIYKRECEKVLHRILEKDHETDLLLAEQRLIEKLGQGIRYYLRKRFKKCPPPDTKLTPKQMRAYKKQKKDFSQVAELVSITFSRTVDDVEEQDEFIATLVSTALFHIQNFFGLESLLDKNSQNLLLKASFFEHPDLSFPMTRIPTTLDNEQFAQILAEIQYAYMFLTAEKACQFLVSLWTAPGVSEELQRQGGWSKLEDYASSLWGLGLWKLCPDNSHLAALAITTIF
jgi:hypothetical protein